ncbi:MAG TPA: ATP-dependent Clp protease ATP-binding subunit [Candidatus Saccharimonadales bacterium]|nr:ATP-dependent Clp protease ATP-binding subunit [Candidatus Saccharimonadales bacterium]
MNLDRRSRRARKARTAHAIGRSGYELVAIGAIALLVVGVLCVFVAQLPRAGYAAAALGLLLAMVALWYKLDLAVLPPAKTMRTLDDVLAPELLARLPETLTPAEAWKLALQSGPAYFVINHLFMHPDASATQLSTNASDMATVWDEAVKLQQYYHAPQINAGTLVTALILTSAPLRDYLNRQKLGTEDVLEVYQWLERQIAMSERHKSHFGGIGRDWASGFTPTLEHFSENVSQGIQMAGGYTHYLAHTDLYDGMINSLVQGSGVAIVGAAGVGKTTLVYGLADRLLKGQDKTLQYHQVVSLNASLILSAGGNRLESLLMTLFGEAIHAGNIILFIDEAQLFFGNGVGAFDISQILLPVLKNRNIHIIAAFSPDEWQQLRIHNETLTSSFSAVVIPEATTPETMRILEDLAPVLEHRNDVLITFDALRETVRLSGQYMQDQAYPGKAINLLEQALPYAQHKLLNAETVQAALEKTRGLKVSAAQAPEADVLLHLEDRIHQRMINQVRAVGVVAGALRRGRAGVSNPKRPVGSFLFLGPTGVGKTELAKSLAAVYFGDEHQMVRLDMSEYQQPEDVNRLLSAGGQGERSLLLAMREQPFSVVLFDEIEKAHPNILNLFLQMLDEGQLTDNNGKPASFRSAIIIATSNAGSNDIIERMRSGENLDSFERPLINKLISAGQFKPELINRFDEVVLFRPLNQAELTQVAELMVADVNKTLSAQNIRVELSQDALQQLASQGYDPEFGARPMRRLIQKTVENAVAVKILQGEAAPGSVIRLDMSDLAPAEAPPEPSTPSATPPTGTN